VDHERVVNADTANLVNPERADIFVGAFERRTLTIRAGRRKCAGQGKNDDALAAKQVSAVYVLPTVRVRADDAVVTDPGLEHGLWDRVAFHHCLRN